MAASRSRTSPRQPRRPPDDIAAFFEALRPVRVGRDGYTRMDRYRDFHGLFTSDVGRRVLAQIVDYCEGPALRDSDLDSHAQLAARAKAREVGHRISAWAFVVPAQDLPEETI